MVNKKETVAEIMVLMERMYDLGKIAGMEEIKELWRKQKWQTVQVIITGIIQGKINSFVKGEQNTVLKIIFGTDF